MKIGNIVSSKKANYYENGFILAEAIVSVGIIGLVALIFMGGLSTLYRGGIVADEQANASQIARSQLEYIKSQPYISWATSGHGTYALLSAQSGYSVQTTVTPVNQATGAALPSGSDSGEQKINIAVSHDGSQVMTLDGYKVDR